MKLNKLVMLTLVLMLSLPAVFGAVYLKPDDIEFREGGPQRYNEYFYDPRVQDRNSAAIVHLTPIQPPTFARGYPPFYPRGTAVVKSTYSPYNPRGSVMVSVKDLRPSYNDNSFYQGWLYDADYGYLLNLGKFETLDGGAGELDFRGSYYFDAYDFVLITREPRDDTDPRPSDKEVLIGMLQYRKLYEPKPLLGERASYGYSYYGN